MSNKLMRLQSIGPEIEEAVSSENWQLLFSLLDEVNWTSFDLKEGNNFLDFALYISTCVCDEDISLKLIELGATPFFWNFGVIIEAISANKERVLDKLLTFDIPKNYCDDAYPMGFVGMAASDGKLSILKKLVDLNFNIHLWNDGAFRYAIAREHLECAQYLYSLDKMTFSNEENDYALKCLIENNNVEIFNWVLEKYPSIKDNSLIYNYGFNYHNDVSSIILSIIKNEIIFQDNPEKYYPLFNYCLNAQKINNPDLSRQDLIDILLARKDYWLSEDIHKNRTLLSTIQHRCSEEESIYILTSLKIHLLPMFKDDPWCVKINDYIKLQRDIPIKNKNTSINKI